MNETKRLAFLCNAYRKPEQPTRTVLESFEIVAYDGMVMWSDFVDNVPDIDNTAWLMSFTMPLLNETKAIKVRSPFNFELGDQFWLLFMPPQSYLNGWDEYPDEIDKSAVVKCQFESVISQNSECAWIHVKVLDVIPLSELCSRFPVKKCNKYLEFIKSMSNFDVFEYNNWIHYSWNGQSDIGEWGLIRKHESGSYRMVLFCQWGFRDNDVYCGNLEVDI